MGETWCMPHLHSNVLHTALIFEGGGMRASYTAAVAVALLEAGIHIDWVAGISAGASNTANYISRDPLRARRSFVDFVGDRRFGGLGSLVHGRGWFDAKYIYEQTGGPGQALPFDWATFVDNPARANVAAVRMDTGEQVWFTKADMPTMPDLMRRVRASSTMPGLMPPVTIGGTDYVDGALGPNGGIALDRAQDAGFDKFLVVLTRERDYVKTPPDRAQLAIYRAMFHRHPAVIDALVHRHPGYNATREELFDLQADGHAYLFVPQTMPVSNVERDVGRLRESYRAGLRQAAHELPDIAEFLGVEPAPLAEADR